MAKSRGRAAIIARINRLDTICGNGPFTMMRDSPPPRPAPSPAAMPALPEAFSVRLSGL